MPASVGRSSLLVAAFVLSVGACNGNGAPVGSRGQTSQTTTTTQGPTNANADPQSSGVPGQAPSTFAGIQATEATLSAVLERMNAERSRQGVTPFSRNDILDQCAATCANIYAQGGQPSTFCGAKQVSAFRLMGGGDLTNAATQAIDQVIQGGPPAQGQTNDYSHMTNPALFQVGISVVNNGDTYLVILYQ